MKYVLLGLAIAGIIIAAFWFLIPDLPTVKSDDRVSVVFTDCDGFIGVNLNRESVVAKGFRPGSSAEVNFELINETSENITPSLHLLTDVAPGSYGDERGYQEFAEVQGHLVIPEITPIEPGSSQVCPVLLNIPRTPCPDKWAFRIEARGNNSGVVQTAAKLWVLVDMR